MYRREVYFGILVCILGFGIIAQAQLFDPPINNPSFEATDLGEGGTGQWVDYAEEWIINGQGNCYLEDGSWEIVAPDGVATLKMWSGAAIWQQIGTWNPSTDYLISMWAGRGDETSAYQVELWAGGNPSLVPASGFGTIDSTVGAILIGGSPLTPTIAVGESEWMSLILNTGAGFNLGDALWLRIESIAIGGEAIWIDNVMVESLRDPELAYNPNPVSGSIDVLRDVVLNWTPGELADKHDVYFGINLDKVSNASRTDPLNVLVIEGQDANSYDVGRLEFGQTYYWRIDEVKNSTISKGDLWSFIVEPFAYPIDAESITATASSQQPNQEPEKTIDGSGLDPNDLHSANPKAMWISESGDPGSESIQYEFDKPYKLHEMLVWNYNGNSILTLYGLKDVTIEYSMIGDNLIQNPSFESPDLGPGGTDQWADYVDDWIINTQGSCYLEDGTWEIVAPDGVATLKMWNGAAIWQQIGNVNPNTDYQISMFIGRGVETSAVQVELWAGGDPSALPTSYGVIRDTVGATLIGGASLTPTVEVGQNELMSLSLNTGAGFAPEDALWLRIESTGEAAWVDNVKVTIDGSNWSQLENIPEFAQAIGDDGYAADTIVAFNGAIAKYVRITANSNWGDGGFFDQYGLSEVRFTAIPVIAEEPNPENGATDVAVDAILGWSTGREAVEHNVYLSTDQQAVIDGTAPVMTLNQTSYSPDLALSSTYFWRVDEVNNTETPAIWPGDVWSFSTQEYIIVDDFEPYNDIPAGQEGSYTVYSIWKDGYVPPPAVRTNGSTMGYLVGTSLETNNVHGGNKSIPLLYDNTIASISEVTANTNDLPCGSDWSFSAPQALVLWLRGDPDNNSATDILYVKIGNSEEVIYEGDISIPQWRQWSIDLATLGISLDNVPTITIGLKRSGGIGSKGVILLDDIMLYGVAPVVVVQPDLTENLTVNPSFESQDLGPGGTGQWADYADDWIINTQGSSYLEDGTWEIVAPDGVATLKMWSGAAIWQQIGNVSPNTSYEISMFIGRGVETSAVQVELWAGGDPSAMPTSYGIIGETVGATLIGGASLMPTVEVGKNELMGLSLNTGADFTSEDALWIRIESTGEAAWIDNVMVTIPAVNLTVNPSFESPDLGPGGTGQWADYVDNWIINAQGNCYLEDGSWEIVAPDGAATLKMWSGAAIWQQIGNVSPNTDYEISIFIGRGVETTAVQVELWAGGDPSALPASYGIIGETVGAALIDGASLVPTVAVGENELMSLVLNTGAGFTSADALWLRIESTGEAAWVDNVMVTIP